jgi:DNA invertase Pin-like site-specific DNA recombinase
LLELIDILTTKNVSFVSTKELIDTDTPNGKFMLTVFGAVFELERSYALQRQREGIAIAKEQNKYKGRKKIELNNMDQIVLQWENNKITATQAAALLKISRNTFYRRVKEMRHKII